MKLTSVQICDYKSVRDSNPFNIGDVTCLVGKNESGKTAPLEALSRLNPLIETKAKFDVTEDFPRSQVEQYNIDIEQKKRQHAVFVRATFTLDAEEMKDTKEEFGDNVFKTPTFELSRDYSSQRYVTVDVDEQAAVRKLVQDVGLPPEVSAKQAQ